MMRSEKGNAGMLNGRRFFYTNDCTCIIGILFGRGKINTPDRVFNIQLILKTVWNLYRIADK
jgi:hypothetical protein